MNKNQNIRTVFLLTIDALRSDHLKSYGYHRNTAPNLERFCENGTIFVNAITNGPETPSAFSAIFTSILPFLNEGYSPLPYQKITIPQILKEYGIFNYAIHSNPNLGRFFNYDRGFDTFLDGERYKTKPVIDKNLSIIQLFTFYIKKILNYKDLFKKFIYHLKGFNKIKIWLRGKIPVLTDILLPFTPMAYNAPYIVNKLISFLNDFKTPLFLWAHFMDVHSPYNPPSKNILNFRNRDFSISEREFLSNKVYSNSYAFKITPEILDNLKVLYDGEINYIDDFLARFFKLINLRFKKDCLVIITSDHGESFYEHGSFGHGGSVFEELIKVPLFIIEMGKKPLVKRINETVQSLDIAPTILDYFGIKIPENFQGRSLLPLLKEKSIKRENYIISECYQKNNKMKRNNIEGFILLTIRTNEWKYIFDEEKNIEYLFNLRMDPKEKHNLITENQIKSNEFRKIRVEHLLKVKESNEMSKIIKAIKTFKIKF